MVVAQGAKCALPHLVAEVSERLGGRYLHCQALPHAQVAGPPK